MKNIPCQNSNVRDVDINGLVDFRTNHVCVQHAKARIGIERGRGDKMTEKEDKIVERESTVYALIDRLFVSIADNIANERGLSKPEIETMKIMGDMTRQTGATATAKLSIMARSSISEDKEEYNNQVITRIDKLKTKILLAIYDVYKDNKIIEKSDEGLTLNLKNIAEAMPMFDEILVCLADIVGDITNRVPVILERSELPYKYLANQLIDEIKRRQQNNDDKSGMFR